MGLKPPALQNVRKRLQFFLDHPDFPKARWEVFRCQEKIINDEWFAGKLNKIEYHKNMDWLDRTQGWPENNNDMKSMSSEDFKKSLESASAP